VAQDIPDRTIGASLGDAYLAGIATGIIPDRASLQRDWVTISRRLEPDAERHAAYGPYYQVYRTLYDNAKDQLHELARLGSASESG
jgi:sugar (pentulose or hexulose) kinase